MKTNFLPDRGTVAAGRVTPCAPLLAFAAGRGLPALPNCTFGGVLICVAIVAQIFNLPYRGFSIRNGPSHFTRWLFSDPPNAIRRYGRVQLCATDKFPRRFINKNFRFQIKASSRILPARFAGDYVE
jgi:hypothetical protein